MTDITEADHNAVDWLYEMGAIAPHHLALVNEAFARHRHQARAEVVGEIVAWLNSMPEGSFVLSDHDAAEYIKAKFGKPNVAD